MKESDFDAIRQSLRHGWIPDIPDKRDLRYKALRLSAKVLPRSVDLRDKFSPVENQGSLGSCTANALAAALELLDKADPGTFVEASRLYIYFYERARMGTVLRDSGAFLRDGVKVCAKGYADERLWPYDVNRFKKCPSVEAQMDARKRRITGYYRVDGLAEVKDALANGIPVVFGFSVYDSMMTPEVAKSGLVPVPVPGDCLEGGHAVCAAGYDDDRRALLVRNSWGREWGIDGYFWLPYEYIDDRDLSDDFWAIERRIG